MPISRRYRRPAGDKTRRGRWIDAVHKAGVSAGAVSWAIALAHRSSATAKPVWGRQTGQAASIKRSDRQVRRYRIELETAGLITTKRGRFERRNDGTFGRMFTNIYEFVVPPMVRARKSSSHRADTGVRSNPSPNGEIETFAFEYQKVLIDDPYLDPSDLPPDGPWALLAR